MTSLIWNIIEINLLIGLLLVGYKIIRNQLTFKQRRGVLLGSSILAISTIFLKSTFELSNYVYSIPLVQLDPVQLTVDTEIINQTGFHFSAQWFYMIGLLIVSGYSLFKMGKLAHFFYKEKAKKDGKYKVYNALKKDSFSFFNRIQISQNLELNDRSIVLEHEKIHANKWHSLDILIIEIFHIIFWFNPLFILIKRELVNLHEYEVDQEMYGKHKVEYMKVLLNYSLGVNTSNYLLTSQFYKKLTLRKRIIKMKTKTQKRSGLLIVIPLLALIVSFVQCEKKSNVKSISETNYISESEDEPLELADVNPEFIGGEKVMMNYIVENIVYPQHAIENETQGTVYIQFIIAKNGEIEKTEVLRSVDPYLDAEALRVISTMPAWIPGSVEGENIAVRFTLPIRFNLD